MNCRKSVKRRSVWPFPSRLDTKALAMCFDVRVFNPFCTVWNAFVIQDESAPVVVVPLLADSNSTNLAFQVLGDQALPGSIDGIS